MGEERMAEQFGWEYTHFTDSQYLREIRNDLPHWTARTSRVDPEDVTGAFALLDANGYVEVWVTDINRPWAVWAPYARVL